MQSTPFMFSNKICKYISISKKKKYNDKLRIYNHITKSWREKQTLTMFVRLAIYSAK